MKFDSSKLVKTIKRWKYSPKGSCNYGECELRVYKANYNERVFVVTELSDNPGRSVTNSIENIHDKIALEFGIGDFVLLERYRPGQADETIDKVTFPDNRPEWQRVTPGDFGIGEYGPMEGAHYLEDGDIVEIPAEFVIRYPKKGKYRGYTTKFHQETSDEGAKYKAWTGDMMNPPAGDERWETAYTDTRGDEKWNPFYNHLYIEVG